MFNIYTISSDIDVFIAFETMNNRGKPLSNLELLKNRLIYLSTKFDAEAVEKNKLRKDINDSWKAIYHYLGKNRNRPLNDDVFLLNHFIVYFGHEFGLASDEDVYRLHRMQSVYKNRYESYLLDEKFTVKNVVGLADVDDEQEEPKKKLTISDIHTYVQNLQKSVEIWYNIFNPTDCQGFEQDEKVIFERLSRMGTKAFWPLLLVCYQKRLKTETKIDLLNAIEKYSFVHLMHSYRGFIEPFDFSQTAIKISDGTKTIAETIKFLEDRVTQITSGKEYLENLASKFKTEGFYKWAGIRYFLYEYEESLKQKTKTTREKIDWSNFNVALEDFITVEHIYPQTPRSDCWTKTFNMFNLNQRKALNNSLGNLLPLSKAKNASLQNKCFADKVDNDNLIGFRYGSYSEIEISKKANWTPKDILDRGIKLLEFMEQRWGIHLGDKENKVKILGLEFMTKAKDA